MQLFFIIYAAGVIGGFAGPLPYDMGGCITHRDGARQQQIAGLDAGVNRTTGQPMTAEERAGVGSLSFECEYRDQAPTLGGR